MYDLRFSLSAYINASLIKRRTNYLMEKLIHLVFMKVDFDEESLHTLDECSQKGRVVYASFQNSVTSLLILMNTLRKHDLPVPHLALDFELYSLQIVSNVFKRLYRFFTLLIQKIEHEPIGDQEFLEQTIRENKGLTFSLLSRKKFKRRFIDTEADSIQYLLEIQKRIETPIFVLPQIMFWNRNPERTKALLTPSATGDRNIISAVLTTVRSVTPAFIRMSAPVNLKDELADSPGEDMREVARRVRNKLLEAFSYEKRSILGPVIKSRQEMMEKVLYHKNVLDTISQIVEEDRTDEKKLRRKAYGYFREIAADFSILYINYFNKAVQYLFRKIFNGLQYNIEDFKMIREASQAGPLIFMPSHKSHMDYLILSSMCYQNKIIPPHIVAGSNLLFFPMGKIFRRSGAFFMRRSFKGLKLYGTVFRQYVKTLINEGYSIEFFIEGGRSRTGKIVYPKMGILKYLIESIDEGYNKDMVFVPLTINYDRILEETSYLGEVKGKEKKAESTIAFVKSRKLLRRKYGSVYLKFSEPVSFQSLRQQYSDKEDPTMDIGIFITRKINETVVVTPFSLVTTGILMSASRGFTFDQIRERTGQLREYFTACGIFMTESLKKSDIDPSIRYVISSYQNDDIVRELVHQEDGAPAELPKELYIVEEESRARINIYKNNIVQFLLPLSFVSLSLLESRSDDSARAEDLRESFARLHRFYTPEFVYTSMMDDIDGALAKTLEFLEASSYITRKGGVITLLKTDDLKSFARAVQEYLESYLIVYRAVSDSAVRTTRRDLMNEIRRHGTAMYHLGEVALPESLSLPSYQSALSSAIGSGIVVEQKFGKKNVDLRIENQEQARPVVEMLRRYLDMIK